MGPGVVLIHQTPKIVWISLGGRMYRCAPEHVRKATERESFIFDYTFPRMTAFDPAQVLNKGEFEDMINDPKPTDDEVELEGAPIDSRDIPMEGKPSRSSASALPGVDPTRDLVPAKRPRLNAKTPAALGAEKVVEVIELVFNLEEKDIGKLVNKSRRISQKKDHEESC